MPPVTLDNEEPTVERVSQSGLYSALATAQAYQPHHEVWANMRWLVLETFQGPCGCRCLSVFTDTRQAEEYHESVLYTSQAGAPFKCHFHPDLRIDTVPLTQGPFTFESLRDHDAMSAKGPVAVQLFPCPRGTSDTIARSGIRVETSGRSRRKRKQTDHTSGDCSTLGTVMEASATS